MIGRSVVYRRKWNENDRETRKAIICLFKKKERLLLLNLPVYIVEGEIMLYEQVFTDAKEESRTASSVVTRLLAVCFLSY